MAVLKNPVTHILIALPFNIHVIGLSKERPILDHHAKAHILDFMKSGGFHTDFMKSDGFQVKSARFHTQFQVKSAGFRKTNCQEW